MTLLRSGCSFDTSPPVGFTRRTARTGGEPLRSLKVTAIATRRGSSQGLSERLAANCWLPKELR
jgi:hypothetical protein